MGIPSVRREVHSYLTDTLHSLISELSPQEKEDSVIVVLIAEASGRGAGTHPQEDAWHQITEKWKQGDMPRGKLPEVPCHPQIYQDKKLNILAPPRGDAIYLLCPTRGYLPKGPSLTGRSGLGLIPPSGRPTPLAQPLLPGYSGKQSCLGWLLGLPTDGPAVHLGGDREHKGLVSTGS